MFDDLIESKPRKQRSLGQSAGAAVIHVVLIAGAIRITRGVTERAAATPLPEVVFLNRTPPPPPPPPPARPPGEVVVHSQPALMGFQTLVPPAEVPTSIPPVDLTDHINPKDFSGLGKPGGSFDGVSISAGDMGTVIASAAYTSDDVDDPVRIIQQPEPRYPSALRAAAVRGTVTLQFVVGTDGRAEVASFQVLGSTDERFNDAAVETIRASTFVAAKIHGIAVRQLVRQGVNFEIRS